MQGEPTGNRAQGAKSRHPKEQRNAAVGDEAVLDGVHWTIAVTFGEGAIVIAY